MKIEWSKIAYPVVAGIILAVIIPIFSSYKIVFNILTKIVNSIWDWILSPISIPLWLLVMLLAALLPYIVLLVIIIIPSKEANYLVYTEDLLFTIRWRWKYDSSDNTIYNLLPYCPIDDTLLIARAGEWDEFNFHCETCGEQFGPFKSDTINLEGKVIRQIDRKIRTGEWKRA